MPTAMELPDKLGILFYNIEESYKKAEVYNVEIKGFFHTGTSKQGGKYWTYVQDINNERRYVMVCNLIFTDSCDFGVLKGEKAVVKLSQNNGYPLGRMSVVYSFKSKSITVDDNELIELYKENKKFISYFYLYFINLFFFGCS
ncbi:hypothetical protein [Acinetobacter haemolyticus]|uniref:hypothetical protein n=1 Tax=Acinetobacter haemolyticus TaxID=29430 RepID=UPI0021CD68FF|nr:hypothetical protein [Acinetobacter haemolyticus]MCU4378202.1 hypothetical protein [Acinetobacter haemolyticus]